eukprot:g10373.t1
MGISSWSCEVLAAWLRSNGKWQEAELLRGADINGSHLVSMPDEEFAEMVKEVFPPELRTFGKRKDLKNLIAKARAEEQGAEDADVEKALELEREDEDKKVLNLCGLVTEFYLQAIHMNDLQRNMQEQEVTASTSTLATIQMRWLGSAICLRLLMNKCKSPEVAEDQTAPVGFKEHKRQVQRQEARAEAAKAALAEEAAEEGEWPCFEDRKTAVDKIRSSQSYLAFAPLTKANLTRCIEGDSVVADIVIICCHATTDGALLLEGNDGYLHPAVPFAVERELARLPPSARRAEAQGQGHQPRLLILPVCHARMLGEYFLTFFDFVLTVETGSVTDTAAQLFTSRFLMEVLACGSVAGAGGDKKKSGSAGVTGAHDPPTVLRAFVKAVAYLELTGLEKEASKMVLLSRDGADPENGPIHVIDNRKMRALSSTTSASSMENSLMKISAGPSLAACYGMLDAVLIGRASMAPLPELDSAARDAASSAPFDIFEGVTVVVLDPVGEGRDEDDTSRRTSALAATGARRKADLEWADQQSAHDDTTKRTGAHDAADRRVADEQKLLQVHLCATAFSSERHEVLAWRIARTLFVDDMRGVHLVGHSNLYGRKSVMRLLATRLNGQRLPSGQIAMVSFVRFDNNSCEEEERGRELQPQAAATAAASGGDSDADKQKTKQMKRPVEAGTKLVSGFDLGACKSWNDAAAGILKHLRKAAREVERKLNEQEHFRSTSPFIRPILLCMIENPDKMMSCAAAPDALQQIFREQTETNFHVDTDVFVKFVFLPSCATVCNRLPMFTRVEFSSAASLGSSGGNYRNCTSTTKTNNPSPQEEPPALSQDPLHLLRSCGASFSREPLLTTQAGVRLLKRLLGRSSATPQAPPSARLHEILSLQAGDATAIWMLEQLGKKSEAGVLGRGSRVPYCSFPSDEDADEGKAVDSSCSGVSSTACPSTLASVSIEDSIAYQPCREYNREDDVDFEVLQTATHAALLHAVAKSGAQGQKFASPSALPYAADPLAALVLLCGHIPMVVVRVGRALAARSRRSSGESEGAVDEFLQDVLADPVSLIYHDGLPSFSKQYERFEMLPVFDYTAGAAGFPTLHRAAHRLILFAIARYFPGGCNFSALKDVLLAKLPAGKAASNKLTLLEEARQLQKDGTGGDRTLEPFLSELVKGELLHVDRDATFPESVYSLPYSVFGALCVEERFQRPVIHELHLRAHDDEIRAQFLLFTLRTLHEAEQTYLAPRETGSGSPGKTSSSGTPAPPTKFFSTKNIERAFDIATPLQSIILVQAGRTVLQYALHPRALEKVAEYMLLFVDRELELDYECNFSSATRGGGIGDGEDEDEADSDSDSEENNRESVEAKQQREFERSTLGWVAGFCDFLRCDDGGERRPSTRRPGGSAALPMTTGRRRLAVDDSTGQRERVPSSEKDVEQELRAGSSNLATDFRSSEGWAGQPVLPTNNPLSGFESSVLLEMEHFGAETFNRLEALSADVLRELQRHHFSLEMRGGEQGEEGAEPSPASSEENHSDAASTSVGNRRAPPQTDKGLLVQKKSSEYDTRKTTSRSLSPLESRLVSEWESLQQKTRTESPCKKKKKKKVSVSDPYLGFVPVASDTVLLKKVYPLRNWSAISSAECQAQLLFWCAAVYLNSGYATAARRLLMRAGEILVVAGRQEKGSDGAVAMEHLQLAIWCAFLLAEAFLAENDLESAATILEGWAWPDLILPGQRRDTPNKP